MRMGFEDKSIRIPKDDEVRADLRSIKKTTTAAGNIRFEADRRPWRPCRPVLGAGAGCSRRIDAWSSVCLRTGEKARIQGRRRRYPADSDQCRVRRNCGGVVMVTLYDYLNRPIKSEQLKRELAAPTLSGVRSVWNETVTSGLTPAGLASLLLDAADGDIRAYLTLAEEMEERDLHYRCEMGKRRLAVSSLPVVIESASDEPKDLDLAEAVRGRLLKSAGFKGLLKDLLDAHRQGIFGVRDHLEARGDVAAERL